MSKEIPERQSNPLEGRKMRRIGTVAMVAVALMLFCGCAVSPPAESSRPGMSGELTTLTDIPGSVVQASNVDGDVMITLTISDRKPDSKDNVTYGALILGVIYLLLTL